MRGPDESRLPGLLGLHGPLPTPQRAMVRHASPTDADALLMPSFDCCRHDRTWGQLFETFDQFLAFSWPVVTVTDTRTGRAHIVTRLTSITAFLKMIKTRYVSSLRASCSSPLAVPLGRPSYLHPLADLESHFPK